MDLFKHYDKMPDDLRGVVKKYEMGENDYRVLEDFKEEVEALGYTFDYGLDAEPYNLRKVAELGLHEQEVSTEDTYLSSIEIVLDFVDGSFAYVNEWTLSYDTQMFEDITKLDMEMVSAKVSDEDLKDLIMFACKHCKKDLSFTQPFKVDIYPDESMIFDAIKPIVSDVPFEPVDRFELYYNSEKVGELVWHPAMSFTHNVKDHQLVMAQLMGRDSVNHSGRTVPAQDKNLMHMLKGRAISSTPRGQAETTELLETWMKGRTEAFKDKTHASAHKRSSGEIETIMVYMGGDFEKLGEVCKVNQTNPPSLSINVVMYENRNKSEEFILNRFKGLLENRFSDHNKRFDVHYERGEVTINYKRELVKEKEPKPYNQNENRM